MTDPDRPGESGGPEPDQPPAPPGAEVNPPAAEAAVDADQSGDQSAGPATSVRRPAKVRRGAITRQGAGTRRRPANPATARRRLIDQDVRDEARAEDERHRRARRRVLIGSAATLGVVGIAASFYLTDRSTTAHCVDPNQQPVSATYCDRGTPSGVFFLYGGSQYHYYYGGSVNNGRYAGGSVTAPKSGGIKTDSGRTIRRGGFGGRLGSGTG
ncbi:MAG: hypothetical protein ABJA87_03870 [bacterium]